MGDKLRPMKTQDLFVAADLGAGSGRVMAGRLQDGVLGLSELNRFSTAFSPGADGRYLRWDLDRIEAEIRKGLQGALALGPVAALGVDSWAVDYVLLDAERRRVGEAVCYRDPRSEGMLARITARIPAAEIYRRTGIQFQPFNTLYQLTAMAAQEPDWTRRARHLLMIPDYLHFRLSGVLSNEYTNASTTQLLGLKGAWDAELLAASGAGGLDLQTPVEPGTMLGKAGDAAPGAWVVAPASHDTASAVVATPLESEDEAFLSSGTWSLLGFESLQPFADERAQAMNVSNEGGYGRRFRVLKNVMGLWLLQRLCADFGTPLDAALLDAAEAAPAWRSIVDPDDPIFLNPASMRQAIAQRCGESGQAEPRNAAEYARCALESLALSYRRAVGDLAALRGRPFRRIRIVGGGSKNRLLNQLCADACRTPVSAGPAEASALGNLCVQMIALGRLSGLEEARALIRRSVDGGAFEARDAVPAPVLSRFRLLEAAALKGAGR